MSDPRIRTLLRQAQKVAEAGKRSAAAELYRQLLEEAPDTAEAWLGLGHVLVNHAEREEAYQKAIALSPNDPAMQEALAQLHAPAPPTAEPEPTSTADLHPALEPIPEDAVLTCYRHPDRETSLRCNRCAKPICMACAKRTSVGYRCPDCIRELEAGYYTIYGRDYFVAAVVSGLLSLIVGGLLYFVGNNVGFFMYFIVFALGGGGGSLVARITHQAIGRRRGRYLPHLVATVIAVATLLPALCITGLFLIMAVSGTPEAAGFAFPLLIVPGIYAFVAASAAFYWLK